VTIAPISNPHWFGVIRPGQVAVFVFDARTRTGRNPDGSDPGVAGTSLAIGDDCNDALHFARDIVSRDPNLYCELYDNPASYGQPLETIYDPGFRARYFVRRAHREIVAGVLLWFLGTTFIVIDFRRDLTWIWGYVIGLKCLIVGTSLISIGVVRLRRHAVSAT